MFPDAAGITVLEDELSEIASQGAENEALAETLAELIRMGRTLHQQILEGAG